ncbi:MAG: ribosomal protein L7/L12, partial [Elusimicrobiales bacterium]|nr:ribosomal protein L7/L12 [Elusimicrobiales bacterium]
AEQPVAYDPTAKQKAQAKTADEMKKKLEEAGAAVELK